MFGNKRLDLAANRFLIHLFQRSIHTAAVYYAARKGTRAKARAKKIKIEVTKVGFIPHNERGKDRQATPKVLHYPFNFKFAVVCPA